MTISQRIFKTMEQKNLKQSDLANYIGVANSSVSDWKKKGSTPSADKIVKISEFLNVSVDYLLGRVDEPDKYLKITYPIDPTEKGIKLSSSNSKPKNNTQFDETTTQVDDP